VVLCKWIHCDLFPFPQVSNPGPIGPSCFKTDFHLCARWGSKQPACFFLHTYLCILRTLFFSGYLLILRLFISAFIVLHGQGSSAINADVTFDAGLAKTTKNKSFSSSITQGSMNTTTSSLLPEHDLVARHPDQKAQAITRTYAMKPKYNARLGQRLFYCIWVCIFFNCYYSCKICMLLFD